MSAVQNFVGILDELKSLKSGVSGSRIKKLTQIAVENVNSESELIEKAYENLRNASQSHKLGSLYVIDSIARAYQDHASKLGESVSERAQPGTFAHGLFLLNKSIEEALNITIAASTPEQKEKVGKLLDIWKKVNVFDNSTISTIKSKYFETPKTEAPQAEAPQAAAPSNANDILKNLATLANGGANNAPAPAVPQQAGTLPPNLGNLADPLAQQAALLQMLQQLQAGGQIPPLPQPPTIQPQDSSNGNGNDPRSRFANRAAVSQEDAFRKFRGHDSGSRDRSDGYSRRDRNRSRSPGGEDKARPPPGHVVGEHNIPGTPHYREKFVSFDHSLPHGSIKVLSRTLFIGGVPNYMTEQELASVMRPFAEVQSVILNSERKHAFVKVYSRAEAENVIANFNKNGQLNLRTRWGVGFGPRDCCDYQHGISIIPIARLTDADKRWVNAAEWGGVGLEQEFVPGLVMEEPDIEIGEGVSSKAISKKMPTDGSRNGPRSTKPGEPDDVYTDPLNQASLPSFMQASNKSNPLANLFGAQQPAAPAPAPAPVPAPAAASGGDANAQLSSLMAFLQQQQQK